MQERFDHTFLLFCYNTNKLYNIYLHARMNKHDLKFNNNLVSQVWSDVSVLSLSL